MNRVCTDLSTGRDGMNMKYRRTHRLWALFLLPTLLSAFSVSSCAGEESALFEETVFASFDTETTGLNPSEDRIIEIAVVLYQHGAIVDQKSWLIDPERPIPFFATRANRISDEMVAGMPTFREILPEFREYIQGSVLMAHNARFDIHFVNEEFVRAGEEPLSNDVIDTLALFRSWYPELDSHTLSSVVDYLHIQGDAFHRALADSVYVARIFDRYVREHGLDLNDVYRDSGGPLTF